MLKCLEDMFVEEGCTLTLGGGPFSRFFLLLAPHHTPESFRGSRRNMMQLNPPTLSVNHHPTWPSLSTPHGRSSSTAISPVFADLRRTDSLPVVDHTQLIPEREVTLGVDAIRVKTDGTPREPGCRVLVWHSAACLGAAVVFLTCDSLIQPMNRMSGIMDVVVHLVLLQSSFLGDSSGYCQRREDNTIATTSPPSSGCRNVGCYSRIWLAKALGAGWLIFGYLRVHWSSLLWFILRPASSSASTSPSPSRPHFTNFSPRTSIPPVKMKFTSSVAFLGTVASTYAQILVPTGPVRGPNTLVFKQINGVPNNECLTFTNDVCSPFSQPIIGIQLTQPRAPSLTPPAPRRTPTGKSHPARSSAPTSSSSSARGSRSPAPTSSARRPASRSTGPTSAPRTAAAAISSLHASTSATAASSPTASRRASRATIISRACVSTSMGGRARSLPSQLLPLHGYKVPGRILGAVLVVWSSFLGR
jgi:hypothetical protein